MLQIVCDIFQHKLWILCLKKGILYIYIYIYNIHMIICIMYWYHRNFETISNEYQHILRIKQQFKVKKSDGTVTKLGKNVAAGGTAGALSLMFVYSLDYARTRLANDLKSTKKGGGERQYSGLVDVYRQTLKSDGIAGLYRGFVISCVGIIVYRGFYFGLFDTIRPMLPENAPFIVTFGVGYAVTGIYK